jgi:gluconolactonase
MTAAGTMPELLADGLGWPEGPAVRADGGLLFVESYRSAISLWRATADGAGEVTQFSDTTGAPNSCVVGSDGVYACQNGGTVGPWRAPQMSVPSIQRVAADGSVAILATSIEGVALNGPNDLCFGPDGWLYFTDPGTYNPASPDPSYIHALGPEGEQRVVVAFAEPVFPNGLLLEPDGSVVWSESYTGHVRRRRPDGAIEDLGLLPGEPMLDGMARGHDGRLYITDLAGGIHVLRPDGGVDGFIDVGRCPTNCAFLGELLYVTDAGVIAASTEASYNGALWRLRVPGGGPDAYQGAIPLPAAAEPG